MTTLMVHLQLGRANTNLLQSAAELARRLGADVMGTAVGQPLRNYISGAVVEQDRRELENEMKGAEAEFHAVFRGNVENLAWRPLVTFAPLAGCLAHQARCADLIITGVDRDRTVFDASRSADIGDLVMRAGRPVLIVPATAGRPRFERVLVAWKDTRESRRAALDALPLLRKASHVMVCEIVPEAEMDAAHARLEDVVDWLTCDGIMAQHIVLSATGDDAVCLDAMASDQAAGVIVAGAYGHSRLREWAFGGVTKSLLLRATRCSFVSR